MNDSINQTIDPSSEASIQDSRLIEQARRDPAAFGKVYDRYIDSIYRYVYNRTGNPADAEDITSQIFLAALEGIQKYRDNGYFAAWLFSIARRKVADHYRNHHNQINLDKIQFAGSDYKDMDEKLIQNQRLEALQRIIRVLPERDKEMLRLRYLAELNFADIARLLKRSEFATKKNFYRLIDRIQRQLEVSND